jgi:hypothetical protein
MKVHNSEDGVSVTLELEAPEAYTAFKAGVEDRKQWHRHPETQELSQFINDNKKYAQISVQCGDGYQRIK